MTVMIRTSCALDLQLVPLASGGGGGSGGGGSGGGSGGGDDDSARGGVRSTREPDLPLGPEHLLGLEHSIPEARRRK